MLKTHRKSALRSLGGIAAVAVLAGAGAMLGSAGVAHPHPEEGKQERRERIIIMDRQDGGAADAESWRAPRASRGDPARPERRGDRAGLPGRRAAHQCRGRRRTVSAPGSCCAAAATRRPAQRAEQLQRARDRLAQNDELSAETRARITAQLDREIARLRGQ